MNTSKGMVETTKKECSNFIGAMKCSSCKKMQRGWKTYYKKMRENKNFKFNNKFGENQNKLSIVCEKCKSKHTIPCNFKQYMEYSGASYNC